MNTYYRKWKAIPYKNRITISVLAVSLLLIGTVAAAGYFISAAKFSNVSISSGYTLVSATYSINGGAPTSCTPSGGNFTCTLGGLTFGDSLAIFIEVQETNGRTTTPTAAFVSNPANAFGASTITYGNGATSSCTPSSGSPATVSPSNQFGCAQSVQTVSSTPGTISFQLDYRSA